MTNLPPEASHQVFVDCLRRAREGDREAAMVLIFQYRNFLLRIIASLEPNQGLVAKEANSDIVQEACIKAWLVFAKFRGESAAQLRNWLRSILLTQIDGRRERFYNNKRNCGAERSMQDVDNNDSRNDALAVSSNSPIFILERKEKLQIVEKALSELRERDRCIFELRQKEGYQFDEIARRMSMSKAATQKCWLRAVRTLKQKVDAAYG